MPQPLILEHDGETIPLPELARRHGIGRKVLAKRLAKLPPGAAIDAALAPVDLPSRKPVTINAKTQPLRTWALDLGIGYNLVQTRLARGWTEREALGLDDRPPQKRVEEESIVQWILDEKARRKITFRELEKTAGLPNGGILHWTWRTSPKLNSLLYVVWSLKHDIPLPCDSVATSDKDLVNWMFQEARARGLSFAELSRRTGVSDRAFLRWKGEASPRLSLFLKCLRALRLKFPTPVPMRRN